MRNLPARPLRGSKSSKHRQRGAAMVEFSLVALLLISITLVSLDFARLVWSYHTLVHANREGLRVAMIRGTENPAGDGETLSHTIRDIVRARALGLTPANVAVNTVWPSGIASGNPVQVQSLYTFGFVLAPIIGSGATLQLETTARGIVLN